jgi:hypothetical protein
MKNTPHHLSNTAPAVPVSRGRISQLILLSTTLLTISASAAVVDISGDLPGTFNALMTSGDSARLTADAKTWYDQGTFPQPVDLNSFTLTIDTGGGNGQIYNGAITGPGSLTLNGRGLDDQSFLTDITFGGTEANTPTSVLIKQGRINLNKTAGVDALAGPITVTTANGAVTRIVWKASNQINDNSTIDSSTSVGTGKLTLFMGAFTDTIASLTLKSGHSVDTTGGGVLTVGHFTYNGAVVWPGVYTSADGFVTGNGSVVVTGTAVDLAGDIPSDLNTYVGEGNFGRLTANAKSWWSPGTFLQPIDLNGFEFTIDNGGGNAHYYNGKISGPGSIAYKGSANGTYTPPEASLGGTAANTMDSVILYNGRLQLNKPPGKDALAGSITVPTPESSTMRLQWMASDQINDSATIDSTSGTGAFVIELGGFSDGIKSLAIKDGDTIDTGEGGVLALSTLTVNGDVKLPGTYTMADGFVTGSGSVVVTAVVDGDVSTVSASPSSVIADGTPATITVTLLDELGSPVSNKSVTLVSSRGIADTISAPSGLSNASGIVTFTVSSMTEGDSVFTASVLADSLTLTQTASLNFAFNPYADISNTLTPWESGNAANGVRIDAAVPAGKIGRLVGPVLTHWSTGTNFTRTVDLNGYKLSLDNGGGNSMTLNGTIIGNGEVEFRGGGVQILNIGGNTGNTYTGTTTVTRGPVRLQKTSGNVLSGSITVNGVVARTDIFPDSATLVWAANEQVNDASPLTLQLGSFKLDGFSETFGTVALTGDFTIRMTESTSQLHFANSSAVAWTAGKVLTITEWDGSATGGGTEGIFFGDSAAGLTTGQLAQIQFVNPSGFDAGTYPAKILVTGEVVPYIAPPASTFESWAVDNAGGQTAEQDYDGDGVPNGVEYFMGETGSTFTATPQVVTVDDVRTITWPRNLEAAVSFKVQISEDLEDWTDIEVPDDSIDESAPDQVVYTLPEGTEKLFVRLVVTPLD